MIILMEKHSIITLKLQGHSNRQVAKMTKINRKTVGKYWNEYQEEIEKLSLNTEVLNIRDIQEEIISDPKYDASNRKSRKYTSEIDDAIENILLEEVRKNKILGSHKQKLTKIQIHQRLINKGFDISYSTISIKINEKLAKTKECFIRQEYEYGDRLEYDFGEVKLSIDGKVSTYYMAVLSSPGANFRWAYLYKNQKKSVFMDSHVRFFEMMGGVYKEVVYDNMKNVVTKFIGKNEKELNKDLIKMSIYYGYKINVTNCFSGNEKGHVEGSVKTIRNQVFSEIYEFNTLKNAEEYLESQLNKMNESSEIEFEKTSLLPYKPKLEIATISTNHVNKYSFIQVDNNFYSVPDYLVDRTVTVKMYFDKVFVYSNNHFVCEHNRLEEENKISANLKHYLDTFKKKPGALKNSYVLKSMPQLHKIFNIYFRTEPKKFIEVLEKNL